MSKRVYKFHVEATWDNEEKEFSSFDICEIDGETSKLAGLITAIALKEPNVKALLDRIHSNIEEADEQEVEEEKTQDVSETKESKSAVKSIKDMTDDELIELARRGLGGKS